MLYSACKRWISATSLWHKLWIVTIVLIMVFTMVYVTKTGRSIINPIEGLEGYRPGQRSLNIGNCQYYQYAGDAQYSCLDTGVNHPYVSGISVSNRYGVTEHVTFYFRDGVTMGDLVALLGQPARVTNYENYVSIRWGNQIASARTRNLSMYSPIRYLSISAGG